MKTIVLDASKITDKASFHKEFKKVMGFPDFYGMNMDAWIDCMSDIKGGMVSPELNTNEPLCIELLHTEIFNKKLQNIMDDLIECTVFVNQRFLQAKEDKYLVLKFL
jgi:RNAse (barnase) inhibitor barstar